MSKEAQFAEANETTHLSDRRREVRNMLEQGLTPRQVALALGLTTQAIYVHVGHLAAAQGLSNREYLARCRARNGAA